MAEDFLPHAVDGDAGHERLVGCEQPLGEAEAIVGRAFGQRREEVGRGGLDAFAAGKVIAPFQNIGECWGVFLEGDQGRRAVFGERGKGLVVRGNGRGQRDRIGVLFAEIKTVDDDEAFVGGPLFRIGLACEDLGGDVLEGETGDLGSG